MTLGIEYMNIFNFEIYECIEVFNEFYSRNDTISKSKLQMNIFTLHLQLLRLIKFLRYLLNFIF